MDRNDVLKTLIMMLHDIQEEAGQEVEEITESTRPIGGAGFFDSLTGVVVTLRCIEKFNLTDDDKIVSLFQGKKDGRNVALTVGEVADCIASLTKGC